MSPEELKHKSTRVLNNIEPSIEADLTELDILQASENLEAYQEETRKWRNKKVVNRKIAEGDWVLRRKPNAETIGKLQSKWDGPYIVLYSGLKKPLGTGPVTAVTGVTGPARFRFRAVQTGAKFKF